MKKRKAYPPEYVFTREEAQRVLLDEVDRPARKMDMELIDRCMAVLDEEKQYHLEAGWLALEARIDQMQEEKKQRKDPHKRARIAIAIVCVLAACCSVSRAVGFDLWDAIARGKKALIAACEERNNFIDGQEDQMMQSISKE